VYRDTSNWKLNHEIFTQISNMWGPFRIDLFADRLNCQVNKFVSWKPDPLALATDAFQIQWRGEQAYAFPPFCLIGRCLAKIQKEQSEVVMITPLWQAQPWFPRIMEMSVRLPILLPPSPALITSPDGQSHPLIQMGSLQLAAWKVSGQALHQHKVQNTLKCWA
jgi:hypothetical protein